MLKLAFATILATGLISVGPAFAEPNSGGSTIGRGCTLDPFTNTMRCVDFDNCTTDKKGNKTCPVVVTPTRATSEAGGKGDQQQYLIYRMNDALISSY